MKKIITLTAAALMSAALAPAAFAGEILDRITPICKNDQSTFCITAKISRPATLTELLAETRSSVRSFSDANGFEEPLKGNEIIKPGDFKFRL